ncbi:GNAT family N-acetyltransferase [Candidatus Halobonum tyrrellensis]|uniref:N-acetyltransferase domain-containing protein n=1 Tax=Candidatus Halobonum tyrrellensis G22 TaxID=1324957 RepID=V4GUN3_9EURY|nr:GNAT family N-acetyltransferase [Candidatus Halobonum tyrrellensis]ESP88821.1 hypothetical protein K933_06987 [Candidatus Halobonum tyrrellensis G22]
MTASVEPRLLDWPPDGPRLRLDHREFAYAGKFVMTSTGKAVLAPPGWEPPADVESYADPLAAAAFNDDRTDERTLWIRYVTVRRDRRGEGLGPRLCAFVTDRAADRGYDRVRIAVNNPYSYEALSKAGFAYAGRETGLAEVVLDRPAGATRPLDPADYRAGLDAFADREDLSEGERAFLADKRERGPPAVGDSRASPGSNGPDESESDPHRPDESASDGPGRD